MLSTILKEEVLQKPVKVIVVLNVV